VATNELFHTRRTTNTPGRTNARMGRPHWSSRASITLPISGERKRALSAPTDERAGLFERLRGAERSGDCGSVIE